MKKALITGSGGLIGSETCRFFLEKNYEIIGIDNNMRSYFFGKGGDVTGNISWLEDNFKNFKNFKIDIRDQKEVFNLFRDTSPLELIVHTAAQPSHDWAIREPITDFNINANGTLNLLEATRQFSPQSTFIFTSTNKVYGDNPNKIPIKELETRWDYDLEKEFLMPELKLGVTNNGITENMSLDNCTHSLFGVSKCAADLMVQEYGKNIGLKTGVFRGGCLTGPQHSAVELHGFLAYIVECALKNKQYNIFGYGGKQVRDQIHSLDVVNAFWHFHKNPKNGEVYNLGGCKDNSISILETINFLKNNFGLNLDHTCIDKNRTGDHICYYSDMSKFREHYPQWNITKNLHQIVKEIIDAKK